MKKMFLSFILLLFIFPLMVSCGGGEFVTGTDAAKLLLSQERLDKDIIGSTNNLFVSGKEAFEKVLKETRKYNAKFAGRPNESYVEVEGDTYKWYNDVEYSNFNSFFESYAINIESSAQRGAELIDFVKNNIKTIDVWVDYGDEEYLLTVDKTSETIYTRDKHERIEICKRNTDENGNNVYELLTMENDVIVRMKYIPNLLYEFTIEFNSSQDIHYLIADKSKGYWNIISTTGLHKTTYDDGTVIEHLGFEIMMMKDEGYYMFGYSIDSQGWANQDVNTITLISNDGKTDLVTIGTGNAILYNTGVKGIDHIQITAPKEFTGIFDPDDRNEKYVYIQENVDENNKPYKIYTTSGHKSATVVLDNGKSFTEGDRFLNGNITIGRVDVGFVAGCEAYGTIPLRIAANNLNDTFDYLITFLNETGISFKRDLNTILDSAEFALKDVENFSEYFQLNGYNIDTLENAKLALDTEYRKVTNLKDMYNQVKDIEVIKKRNQNKLDSNLYFGNVEVINNGTIKNEDLEIIINDFKVKVQNTVLFVEGEKYKIVFALQKEDGSLIPINTNAGTEVEFENKEFEIAESANFIIPQIEFGTYLLVAYVATSQEGIRVTNTISISGIFNESTSTKDGVKINLHSNDSNLIITSIYDYDIILETSMSYTYDELIHYLGQSAYNHGMVYDSIVEVLVEDEWKVFEDTNEYITKGHYRMKYIVTLNNVDSQTAYIYLNIS